MDCGSGERPVRIRGKQALQVFLLTGLPGVGAARAKSLLAQFGSVEAVICASEQALAEAEGIGRRTAQRIHWAVHETAESYLS
jgi:ERCC4-type nuclease